MTQWASSPWSLDLQPHWGPHRRKLFVSKNRLFIDTTQTPFYIFIFLNPWLKVSLSFRCEWTRWPQGCGPSLWDLLMDRSPASPGPLRLSQETWDPLCSSRLWDNDSGRPIAGSSCWILLFNTFVAKHISYQIMGLLFKYFDNYISTKTASFASLWILFYASKNVILMLERVWRKGSPPTLLAGMWVGEATVENSTGAP